MSAHDGDADTIERLRAELKGHAKDAETIKRYKDNLAKARKEKKEADEKVSMLEKRLVEADQNVEAFKSTQTKNEQEIEELSLANAAKNDVIKARDEEIASLKVGQSELQREILNLNSKANASIGEYFYTQQGKKDLKQIALEHVRPFSKKMARKFPSKKVDYKEASRVLISGHFGPWFNHELPGSDNDADFSDCEEFENYHPPGEPESENSSLEDEDEDQEDEDLDE